MKNFKIIKEINEIYKILEIYFDFIRDQIEIDNEFNNMQ